MAHDHPDPAAPHAPATARQTRPGRRAWATTLLVLVALGAGAAGGWRGQAWWAAKDMAARTAAAEAAARAAGRDPSVPDHVRDAAIAHAVYLAEPVAADPLIPWLSRHLGAPLQAPSLRDYGWKLLGGRLLPAGDDPRPGTPLARAQLVYENGAGERLTLYVSPGAGPSPAATALRLARRTDAGQTTLSLYWTSGPLAYTLSGNVEEKRLRGLADLAQARVNMGKPPA